MIRIRVFAAIVLLGVTLSIPARCAPVTENSIDKTISDATALLDQDRDADAVRLLRPLVARRGLSTSEGKQIDYLLVAALRAGGAYDEALAEATRLLPLLPPDDPDLPTRDEVSNLVHVLRMEIRNKAQLEARAHALEAKAAAAPSGSAKRLLYQGMAAEFLSRFAEASGDYRKALLLVLDGSKPGDGMVVNEVITRYEGRQSYAVTAERVQMNDLLRRIATSRSEPVRRRMLSLRVLGSVMDPREMYSVAKGILEQPAGRNAGDKNLRIVAMQDYQNSARVIAQDAIGKAVAAETRSRWQEAIAGYQSALSSVSSLPGMAASQLLHPYASCATNSMLLLRKIGNPAAKAGSGCRFLGVDETLGNDWRSSIGREAWVLLAAHGTDLAGGPRLLDGTFRYGVGIGDPQNTVRRWRDPAGYQSRTGDLSLTDPSSTARDGVKSFIDDNGETYPAGCGPDLFVDLSIPKGDHILSLPLHFSDPGNHAAAYSFSLFASAKGGVGVLADPSSRCLDTLKVSVSDKPSYVRAAIRGPLRCTLVIRRLTSLNANLPGIFLDPDPRSAPSSVPTVDNPTEPDVLAAYNAWQAAERSPLQCGQAHEAFRRYLSARFRGGAGDAPILQSLAQECAGLGWTVYAEDVDDLFWNARLQSAMAGGDSTARQAVRLQQMWTEETQRYLAPVQTKITTGGDDPAPRTVWLAADAAYAAAKARRVTEILLAAGSQSDPEAKPALSAETVPVALQSAESDSESERPDALRAWIDGLGQQLGISVNGFATALKPDAAAGDVQQPLAMAVFAAACEPLLPPAAPQQADHSPLPAPPLPGASTTLLRADQLEMLARAYLESEMFISDAPASGARSAQAALALLRAAYPQYDRMAVIEPLERSLGRTAP